MKNTNMTELNFAQCQSISGGFYFSIGFGEPTPAIDPAYIIGLMTMSFTAGACAYAQFLGKKSSTNPVSEATLHSIPTELKG